MKRKIVEILVTQLDKHSNFKTKEDKEKVQYILSVLVSELIKVWLMFIFFWLLNGWREYLVSLFIVFMTRSFAGGPHEKNSIFCFIHSLLFFAVTLALAEVGFNSKAYFTILGLAIITYFLFASIVSSVRGKCNNNKKKRLKLMSISGVLLSDTLGNLIIGIRNDHLADGYSLGTGYNTKQGAGVVYVNRSFSIATQNMYYTGNINSSNSDIRMASLLANNKHSFALATIKMNSATGNHTSGTSTNVGMANSYLKVLPASGSNYLGVSQMLYSSTQLVRLNTLLSNVRLQVGASNVTATGLPFACAWY